MQRPLFGHPHFICIWSLKNLSLCLFLLRHQSIKVDSDVLKQSDVFEQCFPPADDIVYALELGKGGKQAQSGKQRLFVVDDLAQASSRILGSTVGALQLFYEGLAYISQDCLGR
jgi:hypothetical protein